MADPVAVGGGAVGVLGLIGALFTWVDRRINGVSKDVTALDKQTDERMEGLRRELNTKMDGMDQRHGERIESMRREILATLKEIAAAESKSRHDLANQTANALAEYRSDLRALERDSPRRDDLAASETRIMTALGELRQDLKAAITNRGPVHGAD